MTPQQSANVALARWQQLRALPPEDRIEVLVSEFFDPPIANDLEYQVTLNRVAEVMACTP